MRFSRSMKFPMLALQTNALLLSVDGACVVALCFLMDYISFLGPPHMIKRLSMSWDSCKEAAAPTSHRSPKLLSNMNSALKSH